MSTDQWTGGEALASPEESKVESPLSEVETRVERSIAWEVPLYFCTFGLYFSLYLFRLTRELKSLTRQTYTPWLWVFVPFVFLAQLFAYPALLSGLEKAEERLGLSNPWKSWAALWVLGMCALTFYFNLNDKFGFLPALFVFAYALSCVLFAVLHQRVNRIRKQLSDVAARKKGKSSFTVLEWLTVIVLMPVAFAILIFIGFEKQLFGGEVIKELKIGDVVMEDGYPVSINILSRGWKQVEVGSHSDGDAIIELEGHNTATYILVFHHGFDSDLDDISSFRVSQAQASLTGAECDESRSFATNNLGVNSTVKCTGDYFGDPYQILSRTIETDQGYFELYGEYSAAKLSFHRGVNDFLAFEKEFRSQW
ncbi:hypothetical protein [Microbulbifer guangxiensis]|uniref:hypothetical protein n=1 Tax=Microbulbifer guangxiensis TaxID=2904249 RepID=UPI001F15B437|nr:hypothetical protein [Microbulbifer guangxiensis]